MSPDTLRVLVVDDSAFSRRAIVRMLEALPDVKVIGYACDGEEGLRKVLDLKPDLITLDLEMPNMDGFTLLRIIMQRQPTPIIVVSSRADDEDVFKALELGAVEFVPKPSSRVTPLLMDIREELLEKVREMTRANLRTIVARRPVVRPRRTTAVAAEPAKLLPVTPAGSNFPMVVIASSTGGPPALQTIFSSIQEPIAVGFAVAQHMPPDFTRAFADRLNRFSALEIREAVDGDVIRPGQVLIAPGGRNLEMFRVGEEIIAKLSDPKGHQRYVPSADVLFTSAAPLFGSRLLGVVLTGMGNDGARGVQAVKEQGGRVLAEDEESCVVFGMPREAIATGKVDAVVPLPSMCREILKGCRIVG